MPEKLQDLVKGNRQEKCAGPCIGLFRCFELTPKKLSIFWLDFNNLMTIYRPGLNWSWQK
jgi:hypothetical protein